MAPEVELLGPCQVLASASLHHPGQFVVHQVCVQVHARVELAAAEICDAAIFPIGNMCLYAHACRDMSLSQCYYGANTVGSKS